MFGDSPAYVQSERIGCVRLSGGGLRSACLAAADPRIRAACVLAWMSTLGEMLPGYARRHTWMAWTPGLRASLDLADAAALTAPGALLVQQCARDTLFPMDGMRAAVERLQAIYAKAGIPARFRGTFHDAPHSFTPRHAGRRVGLAGAVVVMWCNSRTPALTS